MFLFKRNGRYHIQYIDKTTHRVMRISTRSKTKKDALVFLTNFQEEVKKRQGERLAPILLSELSREVEEYSRQRHAKKTTEDYKSTFRIFVRHVGDIPLSSVDRAMVEDYITTRTKETSSYTGRKELAYLSGAFKYAIARRYVIENPCKGVRKPSIPQKMPIFLSEAEVHVLLLSIDLPVFRDVVEFAVNTGMRQMEILSLRWEQVNLQDKIVILDNRNNVTKSKKVRSIPLNRTALEVLQRRKEPSETGIVFAYKHKSISQNLMVKYFKKYVIRAKLNPKLHFHSLRHTFASLLVQRGVSIFQVSKLLGHSNVAVTEIYSHLRGDDLQEAIEKLTEKTNRSN